MPDELENLLDIARIKNLCKEKNIIKVSQRMNNIVFYLDTNKFNMDNIDLLVQKYKDNIRISPGIEPYITLKNSKKLDDKKILKQIKDFLEELK